MWTLTLIVGFPTAAIQAIDSTVAEVYLFLYYLVMSVLCLNLFIALLSQFFSKVHNISQTYTLLERAKALIAYKTYLSKNTKYEFETLLHEKCNPLVSYTDLHVCLVQNVINLKWRAQSDPLDFAL